MNRSAPPPTPAVQQPPSLPPLSRLLWPLFVGGTALTAPAEHRDLRWVVAAFLSLIALPYVVAAWATGDGLVWTGLLYNIVDSNVHLTWARQAVDGHFFFRDLYTTEGLVSGDRPVFSNAFLWLVGAVTRLTGLPLIAVYHLFRLVLAALVLNWLYSLCMLVTSDRRTRFYAMLLAAFASGGWWRNLPKALSQGSPFLPSPDPNYMPEAYTCPSAMIFPLFMAAMALLLLTCLLTIYAQRTGRLRYAVGAGIAAALLGNVHTYDSVPLIGALGVWAAVGLLGRQSNAADVAAEDAGDPMRRRTRRLAPLVAIAMAAIPLAVQYVVYSRNELFRRKVFIALDVPGPLVLAAYLELLLPLAAIGFVVLRRSPWARLMALWAAACVAAVYTPNVGFGRKMIEGSHLPMCLLAGAALAWVARKIGSAAIRATVIAAVVAVSSVGSAQFVYWSLTERSNYLFQWFLASADLPAGDADAVGYLASLPYDVRHTRSVLCAMPIGNHIPPAAGMYVYVGHSAETIDHPDKTRNVARIFQADTSPDDTWRLLRENRVGYLVEGYFEKQMAAAAGAPLPSQRLGLGKPVFESAGTEVYEVPPPAGSQRLPQPHIRGTDG